MATEAKPEANRRTVFSKTIHVGIIARDTKARARIKSRVLQNYFRSSLNEVPRSVLNFNFARWAVTTYLRGSELQNNLAN